MHQQKLHEATQILFKALREDKELYRAYQANIAVAFQDKIHYNTTLSDGCPVSVIDRGQAHEMSNLAAKSFLDLLIREPMNNGCSMSPAPPKRNPVTEILETLLAIEMLEYHDVTFLAYNRQKRSKEVQLLIKSAIKSLDIQQLTHGDLI